MGRSPWPRNLNLTVGDWGMFIAGRGGQFTHLYFALMHTFVLWVFAFCVLFALIVVSIGSVQNQAYGNLEWSMIRRLGGWNG
jgi:hypothetical protein